MNKPVIPKIQWAPRGMQLSSMKLMQWEVAQERFGNYNVWHKNKWANDSYAQSPLQSSLAEEDNKGAYITARIHVYAHGCL